MENIEQKIKQDIDEAIVRFRKQPRVVKLYDSFFETYYELLDKCSQYILDKQYEQLAAVFHQLKGSTANIMMSLANNIIVTLEEGAKQKDETVEYTKELYTLKIYGKEYQKYIENLR